MNDRQRDVQQIAAQLLAGLLANPHIYAALSDEGSRGQQEQALILVALEMAENLLDRVRERSQD